MRRALAAVAICGGLAGVLSAQPTMPAGSKLTAEEAAARLEKAGSDPVALLEQVPVLGEKEAVRIRQRINALLLERKPFAEPEEADELRRRLARSLPAAARTPAAVRELLGPPRLVLRQVLYRRYVEQWHYDTPLNLCVVLEGVKGQGPRVKNVLVTDAGNP